MWLRACPDELVTLVNKKSKYGGKRNQNPLPKGFDESSLNTRITLKVEPVNRSDENDGSSPAGIVRAKVVSIRDLNLAKSKAAEVLPLHAKQEQLPQQPQQATAPLEQQAPLLSLAPSHAPFDVRSVAGSILTSGTS